MWDEKYGAEDYFYGTAPNDFLRENALHIPKGPVICLADGEGRNGVWLAEQGYDVTSVDQSPVGMAKAATLAAERGVALNTVVADLATFDFAAQPWTGIVSIFCHLPPALRKAVHQNSIKVLVEGGVFLLEGYTPDQIGNGTGGPKAPELMMSEAILKEEFAGLDHIHLVETTRDVVEGTGHRGHANVVQMIARVG